MRFRGQMKGMKKVVSLLPPCDKKLFVVREVGTASKVSCEICSGCGGVTLKSKRFTCPECGGAGYRLSTGNDWLVEECEFVSATIKKDGSAKIEVAISTGPQFAPINVKVTEQDLFDNQTQAVLEAAIRLRKSRAVSLSREVVAR